MKKEFQVGIPLESDTEYFASETEYHVYSHDATEVCDRRYDAMRGDTPTQEFNVFTLIKNKKNITIDLLRKNAEFRDLRSALYSASHILC